MTANFNLILADPLSGLAQLSDESVQCCVTIIPGPGQMTDRERVAWMARSVQVMTEVCRVLVPTGVLFLHLADDRGWFGFPWRNTVLSLQANGWWLRGSVCRNSQQLEALYLFSKHNLTLFYGGEEVLTQAIFNPQNTDENLTESCIKAGCPEGGTVLDPFSAQIALAAIRIGRNVVAIESDLNVLEETQAMCELAGHLCPIAPNPAYADRPTPARCWQQELFES